MESNNRLGNKKVGLRSIISIFIFVVALAVVIFLIQGSLAKSSYSFANNNLTISGQFGVTINLSGATANHELSKVPTTETKTNGSAIGKIEKGNFKINGSEVYLNVMDKDASGYILITDKQGSKYYINCASSDETTKLYNDIAKNSSK
jgi:hypothetical protein